VHWFASEFGGGVEPGVPPPVSPTSGVLPPPFAVFEFPSRFDESTVRGRRLPERVALSESSFAFESTVRFGKCFTTSLFGFCSGRLG
jgi:hypothetical protein